MILEMFSLCFRAFSTAFFGKVKAYSGFGCGFVMRLSTWNVAVFPCGI